MTIALIAIFVAVAALGWAMLRVIGDLGRDLDSLKRLLSAHLRDPKGHR